MIIKQFLYGSTPYSRGYSTLAVSEDLPSEFTQELAKLCEEYDAQLYSAPLTPKSIAVEKLEENYLFWEILGNQRDHVGRTSRLLRVAIIPPKAWGILGTNPFLLLYLLPPIKKLVPREDKINPIDPIDLSTISSEHWTTLWQRETKWFLKKIGKLSMQQKHWFEFAKIQEKCEISVEKDQLEFCRLFTYSLTKEKRNDFVCSSFSLNLKPVSGLCFRYAPYSEQKEKLIISSSIDLSQEQKIQIIAQSIPIPYNFQILKRIIGKKGILLSICWCIFFIIGFAVLLTTPITKNVLLSSAIGAGLILMSFWLGKKLYKI